MGVSVFPGRENRLPNLERAAQEACARLNQTSESLDDRLRDVLSRLVDELALEGGLLVLPSNQRAKNVAVGSALTSGRLVSEFLMRPRVQGVTGHNEILLVSGPPHGSNNALPPDDHLHLWALGIRTLIVVPLWPRRYDGGMIALYSQRAHTQLDSASLLLPLLTVADAVRALVDDGRAVPATPPPSIQEQEAASRRVTNNAEGSFERPGSTPLEDMLVGESAAWRYVVFRLAQVAA